ncbi:MAG: fumarylacetoacetate hydrolase family protein [Lachnospiraceae bacterium]|nr:fumarylacetoacetate hydrolase family protein [Lachnospiraceae bacterium]
MRLYTVNAAGYEKVMVSVDGGDRGFFTEDLGFGFKDMNELILAAEQDPDLLNKITAAAKAGAASVAVSDCRLLAPIVRPRQDVVCLGINYDEHAKEADHYSSEAFGGERPYTIYFSKRVNRAVADGEPIQSHSDIVDRLDYECELGVIIGKEASKVAKEEALKYVFGYTIINDVSARNLQTRHRQWYLGKGLDGFTPIGPCIVTPDEIGDPESLDISCYINGECRQNSNTRYMIQTIGGAIAEITAGMTLEAGSIIATGTPAGVGMGFDPPKFLKPGDTVRCHIEKIGDLTNTVE